MSAATFDIEIPNEKLKTYKLITFIILSLNFFGFGFVFLKTAGVNSYASVFLLIINAVPWSYYLLNKKHIKFPVVELAFVASAIMWFYIGNTWMGIFLLAFVAIGFIANKKPIIHFNNDGITYPSFPTKQFPWAEVSQVIWKDDMLTIDLKNNKLLQFDIDKGFAANFDSNSFNNWCLEKYK